MTGIVHVRHPVLLRCVPRGHRTPKTVVAAMVTPAQVREAPREAFVPLVGLGDVLVEQYAHDGDLWMKMRFQRDGQEVFGPVDLRGTLEGRVPVAELGHPFRGMFSRTPLDVCSDFRACLRDGRDADEVRAGAREIVADGAEAARTALLRYLDEDVRVAGGAVFVRSGGPVLENAGERVWMASGWRHEFRNVLHPREFRRGSLMIRPDRADDLWDLQRDLDPHHDAFRGVVGARIPQAAASLPADMMRDHDLRHLANDFPLLLLNACLAALERTPARDVPQEVRRGLETLHAWNMRGATGSIPLEEAEECLAFAQGFAHEALMGLDVSGVDRDLLRPSLRFIGRIALPRLRDHRLADEDADALDGLVPSP